MSTRLIRGVRAAVSGLTAAFAAAPIVDAGAQSGRCIAPTNAALAGPLGYANRGSWCEGLLKRYFGRGDDIELVGYTVGTYDLSAPAIQLSVAAQTPSADVTIRALSLTSLVRYQMDTAIPSAQPFRWPLDLALKATADQQIQLDLSTLAIVGCTNRCSRHDDTLYLPVAVRGTGPPAASRLVMKVRADANATQVQASISPADGGPSIALPADPPALSPDALTTLTLPAGIAPGQYRLQIGARDDKALRRMTSLNVRIVVP